MGYPPDCNSSSMENGYKARLQQFLQQSILPLLAPGSLAIDKNGLTEEEQSMRDHLKTNPQAVLPGDIILVTTPGAFYQFFRTITGSAHDHVAIVINNGLSLHVVRLSV
jgi:hypothetical protein